ncbi:MAG TPA: hypothetical protein VMU54_23665 [Planctomycetota bacterium]|nr:hypothetical protein [Planctomycetota bacterium]
MSRCLPGLFIFLAACSTPDSMRPTLPTPAPARGEAKVIVYQRVRFSRAGLFPLYEAVDDQVKLLGFSEKDCYFEVRCSPGQHRFFTCGEGTAFIEADLAEGRTYYIQAYSEVGLLSTRLGFAPVTPGSPEMRKLDEIWPRLHCRELDPDNAGRYIARTEEATKELRKGFEEARKDPRYLLAGDGRVEPPPTTK